MAITVSDIVGLTIRAYLDRLVGEHPRYQKSVSKLERGMSTTARASVKSMLGKKKYAESVDSVRVVLQPRVIIKLKKNYNVL